jgi:hypothetical protein
MHKFPLAATIGIAVVLSGCFDSEWKTIPGNSGNGNSIGNGNPIAGNLAPTISGSPPPNILEGESYEFTPNASDPDGDTLEFTINRKPAWATFDRATGRLTGTPDSEDVGNFTNIEISVTDGHASKAMPNFDITVHQIAEGSATLSWVPPTESADGSPLTDLAGYRIYYGRNPNTLNQSIVLNNPGLTRYVVENLPPARWHFSMTSVNSSGDESSRSVTVSKTIS